MARYQSEASKERQKNKTTINEKFKEIQKIISEIAKIEAGDLSSYKKEVDENRQKVNELLEENKILKIQKKYLEEFQKTTSDLIEKLKTDGIIKGYEDGDEGFDDYGEAHGFRLSGVIYKNQQFELDYMSW